MRAGKLDRSITIHRSSTTPNEYGTQIESWTFITETRAQLVQSSTEEFARSFGMSAETIVVFRIRHMDGLKTSDRITDRGQRYEIKEIKELGRREGLELRCISIS